MACGTTTDNLGGKRGTVSFNPAVDQPVVPMQIRELPADEPAVRRFAEELWLPYNRELEAVVDAFALADDIEERLDEEVEFRLDHLDSESYRAWVAVEGGDSPGASLTDTDLEFAGFITTDTDEAPPVFDRPDRLRVGDFYVAERHRGAGLARTLLDRAVQRAREVGCPKIALDVDVDNRRALGFYGKAGFEPYRHRMSAPTEEL